MCKSLHVLLFLTAIILLVSKLPSLWPCSDFGRSLPGEKGSQMSFFFTGPLPLGPKEIDGLLVLPGKASILLTDHLITG